MAEFTMPSSFTYELKRTPTHYDRPAYLLLLGLSILCIILTVLTWGFIVTEFMLPRPEAEHNVTKLGGNHTFSFDVCPPQCTINISDDELETLTQTLWTIHLNNLSWPYDIHPQVRINPDDKRIKAEDPFFGTSSPDPKTLSPTFKALVNLLDYYDKPMEAKEDVVQPGERYMLSSELVNKIVITEPVKLLTQYMFNLGLKLDMYELLHEWWFTPNDESFKSGFQRVFTVGSTRRKTYSINNWVDVYKQEILEYLDYHGYHGDVPGSGPVADIQYRYNSGTKKHQMLFLGTSPEYEITLLTLCILTRPEGECVVRTGDSSLSIDVDIQRVDGVVFIDSATVKYGT